ncbi:MAG: hypothetical protein C4521_07280 [Actinobacteria bacterium]|nr:MAG: hypothetical protein C4521_07280 [Actinomycetota bacterium]
MERTAIEDERVAKALGLSGACAILAKMLWVPLDHAFVSELTQGAVLGYLREYLETAEVDCSTALEAIQRYSESASVSDLVEELNVESTRLFKASFPKVPAPPYESAWREGEGLLMGGPAMSVAQEYRDAGLVVPADSSDLCPDHVARELEFLAHSARKEVGAAGQNDFYQARAWRHVRIRFESEHLSQWIPSFFDAVNRHARLPFFPVVGDMTRALIESEIE